MSSARQRVSSPDSENITSTPVLGLFVAFLFVGSLIPAAPWVPQHAFLMMGAAMFVLMAPLKALLPRNWLILAAAFAVVGFAPFLPVGWFHVPAWREKMESLGVVTGPYVAVQWRQALEQHAILLLSLITGLWLAGQRASGIQAKNMALAFTIGVALYALSAELLREQLTKNYYEGHFGFFPNRNHTGTFLAMGLTCGLGVILQASRDKHFWRLGSGLFATGICAWAACSWSISRGGLVLCGVGFITWFCLLGRKYRGRQELRMLGLLALLALGGFLIAETRVKHRISSTAEKFSEITAEAKEASMASDALPSSHDIDFRVPVFLDTLRMLKDAPLTGIGTGQFRYVFPQYRKATIWVNQAEALHPESDWLWLAAESGIPAALLVAALVILAIVYGFREVMRGRERSLRLACLVSAVLLPLHGCFDVPGHRPVLAWSAMFLFALALRPGEKRIPNAAGVGFRVLAFPLLAGGLWLCMASGFGWRLPYLQRTANAMEEGRALVKGIRSPAPGTSYADIKQQKDKLHAAMDEAILNAPLQPDLYQLRALPFIAFTIERPLADADFRIVRELLPSQVRVPLIQARAWISYDQDRATAMWLEAFRRSEEVDRLHANTPVSRQHVEDELRNSLKGRKDSLNALELTIKNSKSNP